VIQQRAENGRAGSATGGWIRCRDQSGVRVDYALCLGAAPSKLCPNISLLGAAKAPKMSVPSLYWMEGQTEHFVAMPRLFAL
jgi:hypothetical protein